MIETAIALHNGYGITSDTKRAVSLLEIAASRGSWEAMFVLGEIYDKGYGADDGEALIWYGRAAEAGDLRSQAALARLLTDGKGLPAPQREAAARYWRLAADAGSLEAQVELANLLRDGKVPFRPIWHPRARPTEVHARSSSFTARRLRVVFPVPGWNSAAYFALDFRAERARKPFRRIRNAPPISCGEPWIAFTRPLPIAATPIRNFTSKPPSSC